MAHDIVVTEANRTDQIVATFEAAAGGSISKTKKEAEVAYLPGRYDFHNVAGSEPPTPSDIKSWDFLN